MAIFRNSCQRTEGQGVENPEVEGNLDLVVSLPLLLPLRQSYAQWATDSGF